MIKAVIKATIATMAIRVVWGLSSQPPPRAETHVNIHVKFLLLLSDFNQNWHVMTNFNMTPIHQITRKSFHRVSCFYMRVYRRTDSYDRAT
jgi:hypothetical protein